jgi:hypothetical protein
MNTEQCFCPSKYHHNIGCSKDLYTRLWSELYDEWTAKPWYIRLFTKNSIPKLFREYKEGRRV